ncbi:hypothetical protein GOP47_0003351 [Adiantum capillus-veneris]|uniref:Uncharacterized protein n=1 Tax=Adiantum capillus-veneris TaxID=13818 RepID=A0A9D4VCA5_ADICA|nr:hypothetical protein GOP47_0003351 [Adiantum capillus-veneris]
MLISCPIPVRRSSSLLDTHTWDTMATNTQKCILRCKIIVYRLKRPKQIEKARELLFLNESTEEPCTHCRRCKILDIEQLRSYLFLNESIEEPCAHPPSMT